MKIQNKEMTKYLSLIVMAAGLSACGANKVANNESEEYSSRTPLTVVSTNDAERPLAQCNWRASKNSSFSAALKTYKDNNGQILYRFMNMKISRVPSDFADGSGKFFQFWRWQKNPLGQKYVDNLTPVYFKIVSATTGYDLTSYLYQLRWSDLKSMAANMGYASAGDFFQGIRFVLDLRDEQGQFDALNVVYYDSNALALDQTDMLLPIFDADPYKYAVESDGQVRDVELISLHPFYKRYYNKETWNAKSYQTWADGLCVPF